MDDAVVKVYVLVVPWSLEVITLSFFINSVQRNVELSSLSFSLTAIREISSWATRIISSTIMSMN